MLYEKFSISSCICLGFYALCTMYLIGMNEWKVRLYFILCSLYFECLLINNLHKWFPKIKKHKLKKIIFFAFACISFQEKTYTTFFPLVQQTDSLTFLQNEGQNQKINGWNERRDQRTQGINGKGYGNVSPVLLLNLNILQGSTRLGLILVCRWTNHLPLKL